jgi:membrane associated rhomboid family serine protease
VQLTRRTPPIVVALIALSALGAFLEWAKLNPWAAYAALSPGLVWRGELWRPFTWMFFESDLLAVGLQAVALYFAGRDLERAWGSRKFLLVYLGVGTVAGGLTCLVARAWPVMLGFQFDGGWPMAAATMLAWTLRFPHRRIHLENFQLQWISARMLLYCILLGTALTTIFSSGPVCVPYFTAQLAIYAAHRWIV